LRKFLFDAKNLFLLLVFVPFFILGQDSENLKFEKLESDVHWQLEMSDDGTDNWQTNWFLDGEIAKVENSEKGMHFRPARSSETMPITWFCGQNNHLKAM
jgi:hypothetical protein